MSSASDTKPCPFCGERIKVTAVKCRFCGEFLNKPLPQALPEDEEDAGYEGETPAARRKQGDGSEQVLMWILPVKRSFFAIMAGYMGLLALLPYAFVFYAIFPSEARRDTLRTVLYLGVGLNLLFGLLGLVLGVGGIVLIMKGAKKGLPRCIVGIVGGMLGAVIYPIVVVNFINRFIGP
ncbi:MAG: hypothetical protein NZM31_11765 [Gemmatales bacterium]|nr:hypothetical protein [Gemmatales bacterium]MDW8387671.1 hypothetical protein [Gemmatales bacterium]